MSLWWLALLAIALQGCTKQNPRACGGDGTCSDPQRPFCDVNGTLGGSAGECIAVSCTPAQVGECRGSDTLLTCNAAGDGYDMSTCDLGCAPDRSHCLKVSASNGLDTYLDMVASPTDLLIPGPSTIDPTTGAIDGAPPMVPSFLVGAPTGGAAIRVYVAKRIDLGDVTFVSPGERFQSVPAVAFVATGDITVSGHLTLASSDDVRTAGGVSFDGCEGGMSSAGLDGAYSFVAGGGGGGHATAGGSGGWLVGNSDLTAGTAGEAAGAPELVPLRGGCGSVWTSGTEVPGGGAIQLTSLTSIHIGGTIDATGTPGQRTTSPPAILGAGAGGGILLEAPTVEVYDAGKLLATGGGGASWDAPGGHSGDTTPAVGGPCIPVRDTCGGGGTGAAPNSTAGPGSAATNSSVTADVTGGSGGGGLGRIRINTIDGNYVRGANSVLGADVTTGAVHTR